MQKVVLNIPHSSTVIPEWAIKDITIPASELSLLVDFMTDKDIGFYTGHVDFTRIGAGCCYVVFPEDAHQPGAAVAEPESCTKMVVKLRV